MPGLAQSIGQTMRHSMNRLLNTLMSLNDPQWGKRPGKNNSGPPDLEEVWRNFRNKLLALLGLPSGGKPGSESGAPMPPTHWGGGVAIVLVVVAGIWMASGLYIVNEGQNGVVLRFGKYQEITTPGLRWHLPYPIESKEVVNISQVRSVEIGYRNNVKSKVLKESLMLTDDENIVDVQFAVQYILKSPKDYLFENRDPDESVLQAAETAIREVVGKSSMDYVVQQGRADVQDKVQRLMQIILDRYKTGIQIQKLNMQNAQPPEKVQSAFDDAVKAGQDKERQKNEGQAYANDVLPKARGMAARLIQEAEGYRQQVEQEALGNAERFNLVVTEYRKAPHVTRERLYLDAMQEILSNSTKVLVEKGGNNMLYLPLDKLIQMSGSANTEAGAASNPASTPAAPSLTPHNSNNAASPISAAPGASDMSVPRSRDNLRSRERESRP